MEGTGLSLGEAMALTNKNDDFDGGWLMWIIALAIVFGGNGFGFGGQRAPGAAMEGIATREAVTTGFQYNQLDNGIRAIQSGLCDGFYAVNNSIKDTGYALNSALKDCCLSFVAA